MSIHPTSKKLMETIAEWELVSATATEGLPPLVLIEHKKLVEDTIALLRGYLYMASVLRQFKTTMAIFFEHYDNVFGDDNGL